jgi:hypothetical protein
MNLCSKVDESSGGTRVRTLMQISGSTQIANVPDELTHYSSTSAESRDLLVVPVAIETSLEAL